MTVSIVLVVLAVLVLILLIRVAKGQAIAVRVGENLTESIRPVDVEAFRNLIDPYEGEYLRSRLRSAEFRKLQRERLRAAVEYISCAAHNAAVLLRIAEAARLSADPQVADMAEKLVENAIRLRLYAFQAIPKLYIAMILPLHPQSSVRVADGYEQMTRQVVLLGLQYPMRGISSAL
jgi:hypothetical protein